ncbi:hypothetical protein [Donghicola sp. XS_ASV15]|uniref:hypothetical protein n=1 Tax=Donghicola sp. XS_ASV15 TaxID=3241295 RepID=UPI0035199A0C
MKFPTFPFSGGFRMPWSGDIIQEIRPAFFSPSYSGHQEIESEVISQVAGYGRQLGWLSDALLVLADKAGPFEGEDPKAIAQVREMVAKVEAIKMRSKSDAEAKAAQALETLRILDKSAYAALLERAAKENAAPNGAAS